MPTIVELITPSLIHASLFLIAFTIILYIVLNLIYQVIHGCSYKEMVREREYMEQRERISRMYRHNTSNNDIPTQEVTSTQTVQQCNDKIKNTNTALDTQDIDIIITYIV